LGAFLAPGAKKRAFRCNLFYRSALKKDFRFNPSRMGGQPGCMGEQQSCLQDCDQPGCMGEQRFCSAINLYIRQGLFRASCPEALLLQTRFRVRLPGHAKS
jgi:hypothetical protein